MPILVTGASGLLGEAVCRALSGGDEEVIRVLSPAARDRCARPSSLVVDLARVGLGDAGLPASIDAVIHLAQSRRFRDFPAGAMDVFGVNVQATVHLLDYAVRAGAKHFIYASSGGLYRRDEVPLKESAPLEPMGELGFYLASKVAAETLAQAYSPLLNVVILRPFFIYGPGQRREMLLPRVFDDVQAGRPIRIQGEHGLSINPVHVEDAAASVVRSLSLREGGIINLAGPDALTLREIGTMFGESLGVSPRFETTDGPEPALLGSTDLMSKVLHVPGKRLCNSIEDIAGGMD